VPGGHRAVSVLYQALLTGLVLTLVTRRGPDEAAEFVFRLFRRQHLEKFRPGLAKLGLDRLPHAVACAQYRPQGLGALSTPALDLGRLGDLRYPEPGERGHAPRLARSQRRHPRQSPAGLRLHRPDRGRASGSRGLLSLTASYRAALRKPGTASRSGTCSSLYQRLNSSSLFAGTSAHTIRSPVPFVAIAASSRQEYTAGPRHRVPTPTGHVVDH